MQKVKGEAVCCGITSQVDALCQKVNPGTTGCWSSHEPPGEARVLVVVLVLGCQRAAAQEMA